MANSASSINGMASSDPLPRQQQPGRTDQHDQDFAEFDDADDPRLVAHIRQLPRQGGKHEERDDEQARGDRAEPRFLRLGIVDAVDDVQNHCVLEQIIVERT
jgi:hypothetical protein